MSATLDTGVALDNTMGAMFIGVIVSGVLHGVCLVQAYMYFTNYRQDPWFIRAMVMITCTFDAIHLSFITHSLYHYLISSYHDELQLQKVVWSIIMEALLTGVNGGIVQTFYTYRVWKLSKRNYFLSGFILFLILATTGSGTAWVVLGMQSKTYRELLEITPLTITINALSTAVDILIAASLCWFLHRSRTGFKRSDTIITKLMVWIINTGMLTTICAVSSLIALVVSPNTLIYATFYFCIGRFYTNSFLGTLNARRSISGSTQPSERDTSNMVMSIPSSVLNGRKTQDIAIRIDTTQEAMMDSDRQNKVSPNQMANGDRHGADHEALTDDEETGSTRKSGRL
ncbi:hypothetical protein BKA70DRAFT_1153901 [Coprinopsis sp. MPI-PUGE-AT-0042]|nr:hypothetical protein BKA70DRAFT_1153901 [Coprinopsis sp. MPI-PUGE-AT-0042]